MSANWLLAGDSAVVIWQYFTRGFGWGIGRDLARVLVMAMFR